MQASVSELKKDLNVPFRTCIRTYLIGGSHSILFGPILQNALGTTGPWPLGPSLGTKRILYMRAYRIKCNWRSWRLADPIDFQGWKPKG